uniref:DUF2851 family protein n=2 Tax=Thermorudis TaxID=1649508 RepID=A0A7C2WJZ4_9BACT
MRHQPLLRIGHRVLPTRSPNLALPEEDATGLEQPVGIRDHFPLRRLLALAWLLARDDHGLLPALLSRLLQPDAARALQHWLVRDNPYLGQDRAHEIVVNVVAPFALAYGEAVQQEELVCAAGELWARLPAGRGNAIVRRTAEQICGPHRLRVPTARAKQGLLHLYYAGCRQLRCYECPIAHLALAWRRARAEGAPLDEADQPEPAAQPGEQLW